MWGEKPCENDYTRVDYGRPRIYPGGIVYGGSQNPPLPPRIYPLYCDYLKCLRLPESTPPSQNIPHFSTTMCDPLRIRPFLPEYTPLFNYCMRHSQNLPLPPRIYPPFNNNRRPSQNLPLPPRIHPLFNNYNIRRPTHNLPLLPRMYPSIQPIYMCDPPGIYPSLPEYTPFFNKNLRRTQNVPLLLKIYPLFPQMHMCYHPRIYPSQIIPPFSTTVCDPSRIFKYYVCPSQNLSHPPSQNIPSYHLMYMCDPPRIYPYLPEYTPFSTTIILCSPHRIYPPSKTIPP